MHEEKTGQLTGHLTNTPATMAGIASPNTADATKGPTGAATTHAYRTHTRFVMYILSFLFTLHYTLPVYINSSFLADFSNNQLVGGIYIIAAVLSILVFLSMPQNLAKHGNYRVMMTLLTIEFVSLIGMAFAPLVVSLTGAPTIIATCIVVTLFLASFVVIALINFNMDIFLENVASTKNMGRSRGYFLTSANAAWVVAAFLTGVILTGTVDYWKIFVAAAVLILPVMYLLRTNLHNFKDPVYVELPIWKTAKAIYADTSLWAVFMADFLLQFFYAWMTVYTPIYLHQNIGFNWEQIGIMFSIMLVPFVITELPLGKLVDRTRLGEKEVMSIGFIIIALSTAVMSFISGGNGAAVSGAVMGSAAAGMAGAVGTAGAVFTANFWYWTAILVISRFGASMVEIMAETYFFKKMDGGKAELISFFRTIRPFSYIASPAVAILIFAIPGFQFQYTFLVLAVIMFFGVRYALELKKI